MEKHVIVTGGTGVTGNALIRYLLHRNIEVTTIVRPGSRRLALLPENPLLHVVQCQMGELGRLKEELPGGDYQAFFHLAWEGSHGIEKADSRNRMDLQLDNIRFVLEAEELCRAAACSVFLVTGSQAEYGICDCMVDENTPCNPENGYGAAKVCARQMVEILCRQHGIRFIWARLFSVYGPYDGTRSMIDSALLELFKGESPKYTQGFQMWNYLYSMDAARALALLALGNAEDGVYCVASPESLPLREYIKMLHEVVAPDVKPLFGEIPYKNDRMVQLTVDTGKLRHATGFQPEYSFSQGVKAVCDWYRETNGALRNGELL